MKSRKNIFVIVIISIVLLVTGRVLFFKENNSEIKTIKSDKQLLNIYKGEQDNNDLKNLLLRIVTLPFNVSINYSGGYMDEATVVPNSEQSTWSVDSSSKTLSVQSDDYSKTNIQVENVDEADITKTDGKYIYSLSENDVVITNAIDPKNIKIESKIKLSSGIYPEDLIPYKNKLVVISSDVSGQNSYYDNKSNTIVGIYDITNKSKPNLLKSYTLYEKYYTSRCIDNRLYVIATGTLREENNKIATYYKEDNNQKEISLNNIKYLEDVKTKDQTLISTIDLNDTKSDVNIDSYLMDVSNAYVSENAIYLLEQKYEYNYVPSISSLFGYKGVLGLFESISFNNYNYYNTEIYKFDILKNGKVNYNTKTSIEGETINQYSIDENKGHLRVALHDENGSRIAIFDEKLKTIGTTDYVAKDEIMYSSRFMGDKAYLVTFQNTDPLFVIDLSNEKNPKVLGELKIPGYSMYLHPYDETHLIGIGMNTRTTYYQDISGRTTAGSTVVTGMKMALFDVSDVNNPKEISHTIIGDSRTTSAILTNPKALLFSKEKNLIAIPVNNYSENFEVDYSDSYESVIEDYTDYRGNIIGEGYYVYNINLTNGFNLKGVITHDKNKYTTLSRGLYINNNLFTVSRDMIKVNDLNNLSLINELNIKEGK